MLGVGRNARDGAYLDALRLIEVPHAFGALMRINLVDLRAHVDCVIRALRLAHIAVDAFVGDHEGHARIIDRGASGRRIGADAPTRGAPTGWTPAAPARSLQDSGYAAARPMSLFLFKRFVTLIATLIGASIIVFLVLEVLPGNAAQMLMGPDAAP